MNITLGYAGPRISANTKERITNVVESTYKTRLSLLSESKTGLLGYLEDGGKLIAAAKGAKVTLLLHGFVHLPLPEWKSHKSPMESPKVAAKHLLELYHKYGMRFLDNVYGQYIVLLQDEKTKSVILAGDPYGQRSVYYTRRGQELFFGSNMYMVARFPKNGTKIDRSLEDFFLTFGFHPGDRTLYQDLLLLPPKQMLVWQKGRLTKEIINYNKSQLPTSKRLRKNASKATVVEYVYENFMYSLETQLTGAKKVAVLLGGFDSALVAAGLKRLGKQVETFSFYYDQKRYNQPHTGTVAKFMGIKHHWIKVDETIIKQGLEHYPEIFNRPTNWPPYVIQTAHLSIEIKKAGFDYCYSGDGCDAVFFGYPLTLMRAKIFESVGRLPRWTTSALIRLLEQSWLERILGRPYQVGMAGLRYAVRPANKRGYLTFRIFDRISLKELRKDTPRQEKGVDDVLDSLAEISTSLTPLQRAYRGKSDLSPNRIKMGGSSDTAGIIITSPYMHVAMKEMAQSMPDELFRSADTDAFIGKRILTDMAIAKNLLPKEVVFQAKVAAAAVPDVEWYNNKLKPTVTRLIRQLPFPYRREYVEFLRRPKFAEHLYTKLISRKTNNMASITHCLSLLLTYASFNSRPDKHD